MKFALAAHLLAASLCAQITVHEWGTFTTSPRGNLADLQPCFAYRLPGSTTDYIQVESSMLTFYSPQPATVDVRLEASQGQLTVWYPQAAPDSAGALNRVSPSNRFLEWNRLEILPGQDLAFHPGERRGHAAFHSPEKLAYYFSARQTDAAPLRITDRWRRTEQEKMLFYRASGSFEPALQFQHNDGRIEMRNSGGQPLPAAIVIEARDGRFGYRIVRDLREATTVDTPALTADAAELRALLQQELLAVGLFEKEATALLTAQSETWFAPGTRVLYFAPRTEIDRLFPLTIAPRPASVTRVLVGRVEAQASPVASSGPAGRGNSLAAPSCDPFPAKETNR